MNKQEKQLLKEQKELIRLKNAQEKRDFKGYFVVLMALILLFQLLDMMATGIWNNLQEVIVRASVVKLVEMIVGFLLKIRSLMRVYKAVRVN